MTTTRTSSYIQCVVMSDCNQSINLGGGEEGMRGGGEEGRKGGREEEKRRGWEHGCLLQRTRRGGKELQS